MITGVTMGEIRRPVMKRRAGMAGLDNPSAASVPSAVASRVAETPITRLFTRPRVHASFSTISRYHRSDHASGSRRSMPSVKVK